MNTYIAQVSDRIGAASYNVLLINNTIMEDGGQYRCEVQHDKFELPEVINILVFVSNTTPSISTSYGTDGIMTTPTDQPARTNITTITKSKLFVKGFTVTLLPKWKTAYVIALYVE